MRTWWIWCDYMSWRCLDADFGWLDCAKTANSLLQNLVKDSARNRQSQPWMDNVYHNLNVAQTFFIQLGPGFRRNCIGIQWNSVFEDLHSQWNYMISYIEPRTHEEKMPTFAATLVCVCVCVWPCWWNEVQNYPNEHLGRWLWKKNQMPHIFCM